MMLCLYLTTIEVAIGTGIELGCDATWTMFVSGLPVMGSDPTIIEQKYVFIPQRWL